MKNLTLREFQRAFLMSGLISIGIVASPSAQASFDHFYVEPQISNDRIVLKTGRYSLLSSGVKAGFYIMPKISFEVLFAKGLREDSIKDLSVGLKNRNSFFFRYGSDFHRPIRAYLSVGQSNTNLSYKQQGKSSEDNLSDLSWAIGAEERIRIWPGSYLNFEYARHYSNYDQTFSSISMGLRYEF